MSMIDNNRMFASNSLLDTFMAKLAGESFADLCESYQIGKPTYKTANQFRGRYANQ